MKIKKLLALVLALAMVLSCVTAFAAMENTADADYYEVVTSLKKYPNGQAQNLVLKTDDTDQTVVDSAYGTRGAYVRDADGGVHWEIYTSAASSGGYSPFGNSEINGSFTGKYVLTNKQMYHHYDGNANRKVTHSMYLSYNGSNVGIYYFGFVLDFADASTNVDVSFCYNAANPKAPVKYSVGNFETKGNNWYTYQQVWDLDAKTATLNVYDTAGALVGSFEHELMDAVNGVTVPYKDFYTTNFWTETNAARGYFRIDDYEIVKVANVPVTAEFDSNLVSVLCGGKQIASGVATPVAYNSDAVFTIVPKDEYEITGITVDGQPINSKSEVLFNSIREAHSFKVTAKYDDYNEVIVSKITHEDMPESALATSALAEHYNNTNPKNYYNEGNNIMYQLFSVNGNAGNRRDWYSGPNGEAAKVLANDLSGEYIVEHKLKFSNTASDVRYVGDNELRTQIKYSNSSIYDVFGFVIHDNNGDRTADIKFGYSADGAADSTVSLGKTWTFNLVEWYTIRQVYNFDTMKADMYIYNASGTEVGRYSHDIASGDYKFVKFESIAIQAGCKSRIGLDNLAIYKTVAKPVTVKYDAEMGAVKCDDTVVANGDKVPVDYNSATAKAFSIEAKEGYEIADVKVNGESKGNLVSSYEFKNLTADQELEVIFAEKKVEAPTVEVTEYATAKNYAYKVGEADATSPYTVIMYGKIAGQPENYGFALSNGTASVKLDAKSVDANGTFAIRVVGGAILPGSYTAVPYWTDGEGEAFAITVAE